MEITGCYDKTIFRNTKTGKTYFTFNTKDIRPSKIKCVGICQVYSTDMPLKLKGELKNDGKFYFTECYPCVNSKDRLISFLSGKNFNGIGEKTAEKIYEFVGGDIFAFAFKSNAEEKLAREFNNKIAKEIITKIKLLEGSNQIYKYIEPFGGNMYNAIKIADSSNLEKFCADVYNIGRPAGLSFGCCDSIAKSLSYSPYDSRRINGLLDEVIEVIMSAGHAYSNIQDITRMINNICKSSAYTDTFCAPYVATYASSHPKYKIVEESGEIKYYSLFMYKTEISVANKVLALSQNSSTLPFDEKIIEEMEKSYGIKYADAQKASFSMLKTTGIKILTGGPGTGKSTVIRGFIDAIKKMYPSETPLLCAPTGRAAQRLKEITGEDSFTIHKALNIVPYDNGYISSQPINTKFIIIDEASMIDIVILDILLKAVPPTSFILFCGDANQLSSVGPGNILHDMINSKKIEVTALDVVFRQKKESLINYHAHEIIAGNASIKSGKDFHFFSFETEEEMQEKIKEITREKYDESNLFSLQVLSSVKNGPTGVRTLNRHLQPICNSHAGKEVSAVYRFKVCDKIIMTKNNYEEGYLNGDIGIIKEIKDNSIVILLGDGNMIEIKRENFEDVSPAYAMTVHKSQGSEFDTVIVVLAEEPSCMLQKNLLYTAITRAKQEVFIISQKDAYEKAVKNIKRIERNTALKEKIEREEFIYG